MIPVSPQTIYLIISLCAPALHPSHRKTEWQSSIWAVILESPVSMRSRLVLAATPCQQEILAPESDCSTRPVTAIINHLDTSPTYSQ